VALAARFFAAFRLFLTHEACADDLGLHVQSFMAAIFSETFHGFIPFGRGGLGVIGFVFT
jgi:hypothetical protein